MRAGHCLLSGAWIWEHGKWYFLGDTDDLFISIDFELIAYSHKQFF